MYSAMLKTRAGSTSTEGQSLETLFVCLYSNHLHHVQNPYHIPGADGIIKNKEGART